MFNPNIDDHHKLSSHGSFGAVCAPSETIRTGGLDTNRYPATVAAPPTVGGEKIEERESSGEGDKKRRERGNSE
jgi:hypothetical protein